MLYHMHDFIKSGLSAYFNAYSTAMHVSAQMVRMGQVFSPVPALNEMTARHMNASAIMLSRAGKEYKDPGFNLAQTRIEGRDVGVREDVVARMPYCNLLHFERDTKRNDPNVLLIAPMSGHHASLLRDTAEALLPNHNVFVTDWQDPRDVSVRHGSFSMDSQVRYITDMLHMIGPDTHAIAVCQPSVELLSAVALMEARREPDQPLSMTMMGGPIDTRAAQTEVNRYANQHPIEWFEQNCIATVPEWRQGAGQRVYPGFLQLMSFWNMNPDRHWQSHREMFNHLCEGDEQAAAKKMAFYDSYMSTMDLPAAFYLETLQRVFQQHHLPRGIMTCEGELVRPGLIRNTALMTVEGGQDDITKRGQCEAAQQLCSGLNPKQRAHYVQQKAGHYGIFSGKIWRTDIAPRVTDFIRRIGETKGLVYDPSSTSLPAPTWDPGKTKPEFLDLYRHNDNAAPLKLQAIRVA